MQCPSCHTCDLGYLNDHTPLLVTLPIYTLKIHFPILNDIQHPKPCSNKVLNRPISDSEQFTFVQSLKDPAYGVAQELEDTLSILNPACAEVIAFLSNLHDKNALKSILARLHSLCIKPAAIAVEVMAKSVANIIH